MARIYYGVVGMTFDINGMCECCQEKVWFCFCDIQEEEE